jgi:hypothetical protein
VNVEDCAGSVIRWWRRQPPDVPAPAVHREAKSRRIRGSRRPPLQVRMLPSLFGGADQDLVDCDPAVAGDDEHHSVRDVARL